jgi:tripartite motif-containing protein 71
MSFKSSRMGYLKSLLPLLLPLCLGSWACTNNYTFTPAPGSMAIDTAHLTTWGSPGTGNGQFDNPVAIAVDSTNTVYVLDSVLSTVQKFTASGAYLSQFGSVGFGNGQFDAPFGIAADSSNNIYVADAGNNRVVKLTSAGVYLTAFDGLSAFPQGVGVGPTGNIYVADSENYEVDVYNSSLVYQGSFGAQGGADGQFDQPYAVVQDKSGNLYVSDDENYRVEVFSGAGVYESQWGGAVTLGNPSGLAIDGSNNIYVCADNEIKKFSNNGTLLKLYGGLAGPNGVALDSSGNIYVADTGNHRVVVFAP